MGHTGWISTSEYKFAFCSDFYEQSLSKNFGFENLGLLGCGVSIAAFYPVGPGSIPPKT